MVIMDEQKLVGSRLNLAKTALINFSTGIYSFSTHLKHGCTTIHMHRYSYQLTLYIKVIYVSSEFVA